MLSVSGCGIAKGNIPTKAINVISTIAKQQQQKTKTNKQLNKHDCI